MIIKKLFGSASKLNVIDTHGTIQYFNGFSNFYDFFKKCLNYTLFELEIQNTLAREPKTEITAKFGQFHINCLCLLKNAPKRLVFDSKEAVWVINVN